MRNNTTTWPNRVRSLPVSTTIKPVTHEAEVAVNKASIKPRAFFVVEAGSMRSPVPIHINKAKAATETLAGESSAFGILTTPPYSLLIAPGRHGI
jgi:hypothetical protein